MMKNKLVYLATAALIASGTALAQSSVIESPIQTPILDSYTAGMLECQCATDHPDGHGVPEFVRKSDEMRAKAWAAAPAPKAAVTAQPESMAANQAGSAKNKGPRPGHHPAGAR
jgi:hypothetical protein